MKCPFCGSKKLKTTNSRSTHSSTQTWRRKSCTRCHSTITTYEKSDMSWLNVKDLTNNILMPYKKPIMYKSLVLAFGDDELGEVAIENIVDSIEQKIVSNQKSVITKNELINIVLQTLKPISLKGYINYLSSHGKVENKYQLNRLLRGI